MPFAKEIETRITKCESCVKLEFHLAVKGFSLQSGARPGFSGQALYGSV
jgi:hypothetical protein